MDSQILPPPIFSHSHQMPPHKMSHFDAGSSQKNYHAADRSSERRPNSFIYPSRTTSITNYPLISRTAARTQSPTPATMATSQSFDVHQRQNSNSNDATILPHLQIPPSINSSGGSLAEFAAQITCLFWFESTETLRIAEKSTSSPTVAQPLVREAIPASGFRKWVVTILSTTQVTQNVILLALLFIYRLKHINPTVKGKLGSEYRLLTVALMLGNKFLDDNTYTNKTWAEVSGIAVGEIHVMEVEFLSNMRYSLLASMEQWKDWQLKLGNFWNYFDRASRASTLPSPPVSAYSNSSLLPSPPVSMQSSPPHLPSYPPTSSSCNHSYPQYNAPSISPLPSMPDFSLRPASRKRSYDDNADEPPSKRMTYQPSSATPVASSRISNRDNLPRLPIPNLSISTREPMHPVSGNYSAHNGNVLPPINSRAMSSVYPTTPSAYTQPPQHQPLLTPTGTQHPSHNLNSAFGTPSRHQSPHSVQDLLSVGSSPISASFPRGNSFGHNSPSIFLQQRSSPYKPIRHVNTLLHPPPPNSMQGLPTTHAGQMHYQPLGKRNDFRSGIVPDYQSNYSQPWPSHALPQPNFHA